MDIQIMKGNDALLHQPTRPTYAIRIFSHMYLKWGIPPLQDSTLYLCVKEYLFDDTEPGFIRPGEILFNEGIAREIISDFNQGRAGCNTLMIHCLAGKNRSPAVGISLNDIFYLGQDSEQLKQQYPAYREYLYRVMMETAKKMSL